MTYRRFFILVIAIASGVLVPFFYGGAASYLRLLHIPVSGLLLLVVIVFLALQLDAVRFRILIKRYSGLFTQLESLKVLLMVGFMARITPGGAGAALGLVYLSRRYKVPVAGSAAVAALRSWVNLVIWVLILAAIVVDSIKHRLGGGGLGSAPLILALFLGCLVAAIAVFRNYRAMIRSLLAIFRGIRLPARFRYRIARRLLLFHAHLAELLLLPRLDVLVFLGLSVVYWVLRCSIIYVAVRILGGHLSWSHAVFIQIVAAGAGSLLMLPGGSGGAELVAATMLQPQVGAITGTVVLIWRFMTFYLHILLGAPVMMAEFGGKAVRLLLNGRLEEEEVP